MSLFSQESMQQLRSHIDLVELLSCYLPLKRAGTSYKALCPFHEDKTPSFTVKQGDTHYHCFGCGAHGDAMTFLMQHEHLSFQEAVETLAERFHVALHKTESGDETSLGLLRQALEEAARFYHFYLLHSTEGHQGLAYLYARAISLDFIQRHQLGFAPRAAGLMERWLDERHISTRAMREAGLLNQSGRPFFQDRVLFPVHQARG